MCGIAGYQGTEPHVDAETLIRSMAHRGPDGSGVEDLTVAGSEHHSLLVHLRLAIIDTSSSGDQPMAARCSACGTDDRRAIVISYNGEIYNYPDLRSELQSAGHRFHSQSDTEVLLHLWAEEGPGMLARLNGIYALAIWDGRASGRHSEIEAGDLLIARDPIGVKPLYIAERTNSVAFSSELKALVESGLADRELDLLALEQSLCYLWTPGPRTLLRSVKKVGPGEALILRRGRIQRRFTFRTIDPMQAHDTVADERDAVVALRSKLADAVKRQLVSDVPVGLFLSGGLDSSLVAALAHRAAPASQFPAYCVDIGANDLDGAPSDTPFAQEVARHLGLPLTLIPLEPSALDHFADVVYQLDEPNADPAALNTLLVARQARKDGVEVLLSGTGGDDLFGGYRRHTALMHEDSLTRIPLSIRRAVGTAARHTASWPSRWIGATTMRRARRIGSLLDASPADRLSSLFAWNTKGQRRRLLSPEVLRAMGDSDAASPLRETLAREPVPNTALRAALRLELRHFLADHNLNYTDKMGMAAGIEIRVPLLDLEVADYACSLADDMKVRGRIGKWALREAARPFLPESVLRRSKTGFGAPMRLWMVGPLATLRKEILESPRFEQRGLFDVAAVRDLEGAMLRGAEDAAYTLFSVMVVEQWCRWFIDNPGRSQ